MTITKPSGGVQQTEKLMTGTQAVAQAVRLADVDVMAAYPIRPYDGVMQAVAKLIANGELDAEYIVVGSLRRHDQRVRIAAQLLDAETGHHIWADRWNTMLDDAFHGRRPTAPPATGTA